MKYDTQRQLYYAGILVLILYALPGIGIIKKYLYPVLELELINNLTVISIIALAVLFAAFMAYRYRKIG